MPKRALLFANSLVVAGAMAVAGALLMWSSNSAGGFVLCLVLALLGATLKVPVPGMTGTISPSVVPILFAAGSMGWQESVIIAAAAGLVQCLWRPKRKPTPLQALFNGANFAISNCLAHSVSHHVAASTPLMLFLVAAVVFQLADTLSVATILSLLEETPVRAIWRNCHLWSFPYFLASGGFAAAWAQMGRTSLSAAIICLIVLYLMSTFYQEVVARMGRVPCVAAVGD